MPFAPLLALLLVALTAGIAAAQTVVGELVDAATGAPVAGAFVYLLDEQGTRAGGAMTRPDGRFEIRAQRPGRHVLRAERIGYETRDSRPMELERGQVVQHRFEVDARPFVLEGLHVEADRRCVTRPEEGLEVARVWEEASKALRATALTADEAMYIYVVQYYRTELEPRGEAVQSEESWERVLIGSVPFVGIEPERMAERGFIAHYEDGSMFYGPDVNLLLSDPFLDTHCLRLTRSPPEEPGLVGIEFRPIPGRDLPDIQGVVWLDAGTAALRRVDYGYVGRLPFRATRRLAGGTIDFEQLPQGGWIVGSWRIRMPRIERGPRSDFLRSIRVEGADVLEVRDRDGRVIERSAGARTGADDHPTTH